MSLAVLPALAAAAGYGRCAWINPPTLSTVPASLAHVDILGGLVEFTDAWAEYRTHLLVEGDCAQGTIVKYGSTLRLWDRFLTGRGVRWDAADRDDLKAFLARRVSSGPRRGQPLAVNMRRHYAVAIRGLYRYAALAGLIDRDPLALVRLPRRRQSSPRSFLPDQLALILRGARDDDRLYLLVRLGYDAGLRRAEIAALDLADLHRDPWPGMLRVVGKGDRERWVPVSPVLRRAIDRHLGDRDRLAQGPLVANRRFPGEHLTAQTVGDLLAAHIRGCGVDPGSAHWLRHTSATNALAALEGTNLNDVREFLGHQDPRTTMAYISRFKWNVRRRVVDVLPDPDREVSS
jgi:integrase/recombinase XerD